MKNIFSLLTLALLCSISFSNYALFKKQPTKKAAVSKPTRQSQQQEPRETTVDTIREFRILLLSEVKNQKNPLLVLNIDEFIAGDLRALPAELIKELQDVQARFPDMSQEEQMETMLKLAAQLVPYHVFVDERIPAIFTEAFQKGARILAITCHAPTSSSELIKVIDDQDFSFAASAPVEGDQIVNFKEMAFLYKSGILFAGHPELIGHAISAFFNSNDMKEYSVILLGSIQNFFAK